MALIRGRTTRSPACVTRSGCSELARRCSFARLERRDAVSSRAASVRGRALARADPAPPEVVTDRAPAGSGRERGHGMLLAVEDRKCIRARRMFSLALDGEAAASEVLMATTHIASCEGCRQFAERVVALTNELRSVGASSPHHQKANARERGKIMQGKRISRVLLLAALTATIGATAAAGQVGQKSNPSKMCPERARNAVRTFLCRCVRR